MLIGGRPAPFKMPLADTVVADAHFPQLVKPPVDCRGGAVEARRDLMPRQAVTSRCHQTLQLFFIPLPAALWPHAGFSP
jgi:hypothetical protein